MRVLLIDIDSKIPNLALMKISAYHKKKCDIVGFDISDPDKVYCSVIFKKNRGQAIGLKTFYPNAEFNIGGCGYSLDNKLPDYIEYIKPDYDLYPSTYSQGYTTRGCIRKCDFCIVPEKEGKIKEVQHPEEFHAGEFDTCMIMDNNLFGASEKWQKSIFDWYGNRRRDRMGCNKVCDVEGENQ